MPNDSKEREAVKARRGPSRRGDINGVPRPAGGQTTLQTRESGEMDEGRLGRGQPHMGEWLGDCEDLVGHKSGDGAPGDEQAPPESRRWNPIVYRCAFCGESFVSRAMIRRHLERHSPHDAADQDAADQDAAGRDAHHDGPRAV